MDEKLKKTVRIIIFIFIAIGILAIGNKVEAASATIKEDTTVTVGDTVNVTINVTAGAWNLSVNGGGLSTSDSTKLVGQTDKTSNSSASKVISFSTSKAGTYTITLTGDITDYDDSNSKINKNITVTVKEKESDGGSTGGGTKPTAGTLTFLQVGSKSWKNPSATKSFSVSNDVTSVKVSATTSTGEAYTISSKNGTGSPVKLEEGTNKITIKLASGKVYTVNVSRDSKQGEVPPNVMDESEVPTEEEKMLLKSLTIDGFELVPVFSQEVYSYRIEQELGADVTSLSIKGIANIEGAIIEIKGNDALVEGENVISIIVKNADGTKIATYQITVNKAPATVQALANTQIPQQVSSPRWNTTQKILITVFTSIIAFMGIGYAVIEYRDSKRKQEEDQEEEEDYPYGKLDFKKEEPQEEKETIEQTQATLEQTEESEKKGKNKGRHF